MRKFVKPAARINWQEGLARLADIAGQAGINWWTTGKILLPLHGIDADIDDLDFYFHAKDLEAVNRAFGDYIVEPIVRGGSRGDTFGYNGRIDLGCPVCMFAEPLACLDDPEPTHFGPYAAAHLETIGWNGRKIKAPPIALYIKTLQKWGKTQQAQTIQKQLEDTLCRAKSAC